MMSSPGNPSNATQPIEGSRWPTQDASQPKKKKRYSREEKRNRKSQSVNDGSAGGSVANAGGYDVNQTRPQKVKRRAWTWEEGVEHCIREALATDSIALDPLYQEGVRDRQHQEERQQPFCQYRVVTNCSLRNGQEHYPPYLGQFDDGGDGIVPTPSASLQVPRPIKTIRVQPLLILDLNGILCYRKRKRVVKEMQQDHSQYYFRHSIGKAAGTPIIPRTDLTRFLQLVESHFCLAVWTSAQRKTVNALLPLLLPPEVRNRLLFVWAQNQCHAQPIVPVASSSGYVEKVTYQKLLNRVWAHFPLWNANNTLIMDDSPDKCPFAPKNAIHPPSLHGQSQPPTYAEATDNMLDWRPDSDNEETQYEFFQRYIQHWHQHSYEDFLVEQPNPIDGTTGGSSAPAVYDGMEKISNRALEQFLHQNATGHMGWGRTE